MQSTFSGIELGKRGLIAHTQGMNTVGHNITNASTEGYSRQRILMSATDPIYYPGLNRENTPGQIGQGVDVQSVERVRDGILEGRIVSQANLKSYWETRDNYILMAEQVYNEPTDLSLRHLMDQFWDAWQDVSLHPDETGSRQAVLTRGQTLVDGIQNRYQQLSGIRDMLDEDVRGTVREINDMTVEIASLNDRIERSESLGDNPNDLLDRRDLLVQRLSGYINITVDNRDPDEFNIHSGGIQLVQGREYTPLEIRDNRNNEGYADVYWPDIGDQAQFSGGRLAALVGLRDGDIRAEVQGLDSMTVNFMDMVNNVHRRGFGLDNEGGRDFFVERPFVPNVDGDYDANGDGALDSTYVFRLGGSNVLDPQEQIGLEGTMTLSGSEGPVEIAYRATDTVGDLISRINHSGAETVASLDRDGRLSLKATTSADTDNPDFVLRHVEDSGQFLVGYAGILRTSGAAGAFDWQVAGAVGALSLPAAGGAIGAGGSSGASYAIAPLAHPAGWMEINGQLTADPARIAASVNTGDALNGPGNGNNALDMASLRYEPVMIGRLTTFDSYFADAVANVGLLGEQAEQAFQTQDLVMKDLTDLRSSISGVNLDEELALMIQYQQAYSASARFISEVTNMIDTVINRMGV